MYEVLVRLEDADGRLMTPAEFIPDAESLDLIRQIDERVMELAFDRWKLFDDASATLHISARSVGAEFAEIIVQSAREKDIDPGAFIFEITETATMRSSGHAAAFVKRLTAAGFRLAIDDFGSGTTSIQQIRSLDFHFLKLDGSLVKNLKADETDRAFVSALTALARALGVEIIAEYVQDEESIAFLAEIGVGYGQGYYLGKPEPFPAEP
jgi:EAL domain-containing protein (putative c-di-GMP-specific phosphodiesterase class I)